MGQTNAERQQKHREKLRTEGKIQRTITIVEADWKAGFDVGLAGGKGVPPKESDGFSWMAGFIEGKAKAEKK